MNEMPDSENRDHELSEERPPEDSMPAECDAPRREGSSKRSSPEDLSGRSLGGFLLLRRLGRGAMAEVYLAEQQALRRRVALKILKPELAEDRTDLKRFEREAQAAASLVHANIVQIYEVGHVDGLHYIAQEYVQGQNLQQWIRRNGPPDLPHALSVMRQVAAALAKAADQGVIHRDIKPENILLTPSGEVKVADFGLARVLREGETLDMTRIGMTLGTPLYMSPEQVEGRTLDARSDIYSFGVTCYHMLAGSPPFEGETALAVAIQHLKTPPKPLETLRRDLPAALCRLVHQMLVKAPERRCASARVVLEQLRHLRAKLGEENWPAGLPAWEPIGEESSATLKAERLQELDRLMAAARKRSPNRWPLVAGVAAAVALFIGGYANWLARGDFLLDQVEVEAPSVNPNATALSQYFEASLMRTEEAWLSVIRNLSDEENTYFVDRAKQQLARIYLRESRNREALHIFDDLALNGNDEFRAFGLAGQFGVLLLREDRSKREQEAAEREASAILAELWPIRYELRDDPMRRFFEAALRLNAQRLDERDALDWDRFLEDHFGIDD